MIFVSSFTYEVNRIGEERPSCKVIIKFLLVMKTHDISLRLVKSWLNRTTD
ncbi:hypothetical protein AAZX31_06G222100 [Glycine max]